MGRPANKIVDGKLRCVRCKQEKPVEMFHRHHATATGYRGTCIECLGHEPGKVGRPPRKVVDGKLECTSCWQWLPEAEFRREPKVKTGRHSHCRSCENRRVVAYQGQSVDHYIKHVLCYANKVNLATRRKRKNTKAAIWQDNCITPEFVRQLFDWQNGRCAITGLPMTWVTGGDSAGRQYNVSVDRIDSEQGYVPGNIQLVCKAINLMKHDFTNDQFRFWCRAVCSDTHDPLTT